MMNVLIRSAVMAMTLVSAQVANAGIPVIDGVQNARGIAEFVQTLAQWAEELAQLEAQYSELQRQSSQLEDTHDALNGVRGMGSLATNDMEYLPEDWEGTQELFNGSGGIGGKAQAFRDASKLIDADELGMDENSHTVRQLKAQQNQLALNHTINAESYRQASVRIQNLKVLLSKVNDAPDQKDIQDLQARIQSEQTFLQNEQAKLDMLARLQDSQREVNEQKSNEATMKYSNWKDVEW